MRSLEGITAAPAAPTNLLVHALDSRIQIHREHGEWEALVATLEQRESLADEPSLRVSLLLQRASALEEGLVDTRAAIATFEHIREIEPSEGAAIDGLLRLYRAEGFLGDLETLLTWRTATMPTGEAWGDTLLELAELLAADPARGLQAVGAYEDLLGWNPGDRRALEGLWTLAESGEEETVWASSLFLASSARDRDVPEETVRALRILLDHPSSDLDRASLLQEMAGLLEDRIGDDAGAFDANLEAWTHRPLDQPLWQDVTRLSLDLGRSEQLHEALLLTHAGMPDSTGRLGIALEGGRHFAQDQESPELAEELYLRALEENPDHPEAIAGLEDIYRSLQRWDDLAAILGKRIDLQMGPSRTLSLERAEILAKHLGDFNGARDCLQAILDLDPGDADALASLDGVLTSGGEWSDLVGVIGRRAALHEEGSREGARHLVRQLQVVHGRIADASEAQGLAEALLGNAFAEDDALAVLRALFDKGHARGAVLEHLITGYEARANWKHLAECLSARVEDDPEDATALLSQLVHVLRHKIGDDRSAYEHLCRLTERAPDHARLDTLEGIAEQLDCRDDLAARLESWALDQEPTWGLSLDLRAAAIQRGRPHLAEHAIESYRRVLGREPGHALAAEGLLATLEMQGHWEDLVDALISLSTLPEREAERRDLLGRAAGVAEEGLQDPLRAAEIHAIGLVATDSEDPGWGAIERLYQAIDERDRLQSHYAQWATTSPDPEGIHLRHARHLATQTDWEGLLAVVEGALKDAPDHPSLVGFLERIVGDVPVEAEISNGLSARGAVASLLAGTYDEHTPWMNWMHVTDARLSCARDALERRALLVFAGGILRDRAQDPRGAFARYGEALRMAPADATVLDLAVLSAEESDCLEDLLELHASIAADGGEEASSHALKAAILAENRLMDDVRARTLYQQVLVLEPGQGEALDALERHARALGDTPQLRQVLGDRIGAAAEPGDQARWYREIGGLHLQEGNPEEAISALRASLRIGPGMPQTLHDLVDVLRSTGDHAGLVAALNQGAEAADDVQGALAYLHEAADVLEVHLHDLPSAIDMHHRILEETATDALSFGALEQLLPRVEDWDGLTQLLSLRLQGDLPSAERASCHQRLGDIHREHLRSNERALDHYRLALEHAPRHEETIASLESLAATGEHALAASFVLEAEHEASGDHERLCALHALQLPLLDDPSECLDLLDRSIRLRCDTLRDPDGAVHLLLDALQGVLDFEVIQPLLDALLETHPVHDTAVAGLVTRLAGRRIPGDERPLRRWIAWTSERPLGDLDEAAHQWRRLVDLDPSNGSDRASLERTLRGQERWGDLVNALEEHLDYAPRESRAERLLELAQLCTDSLLEPHRALSHLRDLLWEDPSDLHAQNALAKLATTASDACAEIFDILAPIYRQEGRFEPLVELLDAQIGWLDDPMEEARSLIQKMEILGTRMHASDRSFEAGIAGLGAAGEVALPHVRAIEEVAAGDPELERLVHALGEAAGGPVSPGVRTDLSLHAARISEERLETPHVAERHLLNVLSEQPQHKEALTRLERLYVQDHRHPELIALCERQVLLPMESADRVRLLIQIAESSQSIGDTERAIQAMESVLAREPTHPQALSTLRTIHLDQGDAHNAIPLLRLEADQPGLVGAQRIPTLLALAQLQEGSEETRLDAVTSYEDILSHDPLHSEALAGLEALHVAAGRWDALAWVLRQRVKATPPGDQQVDVHRSLGQIHAQHLDEPMIALDCFGQVLHADPCDAVALEGSLRILEGQGMWSDLAEMLQGAIADSGSRRSPGISLRLARVLLERLDDPRGASLAAARALEEDPTSVDALRIAAETAEAADNAPRVLEALEAALRETLVTDQEVGLLRLKGQLLFEYSHEPGAALEALLRAARIAPLNEEVNDLLVRIYRDRGRWDALVGVLERQFGATEDPVGASEIAREIASILKTSLQDSAAAIPWLEKAHSLVPENPSIAEDLVEAHPAHAENARIATLLEWLLADASTRGDHSGVARHAHRLGLLRRSQGDPLGALALQRRAQRSDPRHLKSLFALAMDLMRAGNDAEALIPLQSLQLRQDALEETEKVDVLAALASVADGAGERPKAVLLARRALAIDPDREDLQRLVEDAEITSGENR